MDDLFNRPENLMETFEPGSRAELEHLFNYDQRHMVWDFLAKHDSKWQDMDYAERNKTMLDALREILEIAKVEYNAAVDQAGSTETMGEFLATFLPMHLKSQEMSRKSESDFPNQQQWIDDNAAMLRYLNLSPKEIVDYYERARAKFKAQKQNK